MSIRTYLISAVCILSMVVGLTGNFLIIVVRIYKQFKRRNTTAYAFLICQLAVADFVFAFTLIFDIHALLHQDLWLFGSVTCKFIKSLQSISISTTVGFLTVMAYERYCGLSKPLQHRWSIKKTALIVGLIWLYISLTFIPYIKAIDVLQDQCYEVHHPSEDFRKAYTMFMFLTNFILPLLSIIIFHTLIVIAMAKHKQAIGNSRQQSTFRESVSSSGPQDNQNNPTEERHNKLCCREVLRKLFSGKNTNASVDDKKLTVPQNSRRSTRKGCTRSQGRNDHKLVKMLAAVTLCFVFMTLPTQIFYIWYDFSGQELSTVAGKILEVLASLVYVHCCANCIIYSAMDKRFRTDVQNMFCYLLRIQKPKKQWPGGRMKALTVNSNISSKRSTSTSSRSAEKEIRATEEVVLLEIQSSV